MRLHELAKKHGFNQQDLLTAVQKEGFDVKNTLMVVYPAIESWVAGQAASGWTPPPPEKKAVKKKKIEEQYIRNSLFDNRVRFQGGVRDCSVSPTPSRPAIGPAGLLSNGHGKPFSRNQTANTRLSCTSGSEVKNSWRYTPVPPCIFIPRSLVTYRYKFNFQ